MGRESLTIRRTKITAVAMVTLMLVSFWLGQRAHLGTDGAGKASVVSAASVRHDVSRSLTEITPIKPGEHESRDWQGAGTAGGDKNGASPGLAPDTREGG